ncbi:glycosyltransferase family 4 protein [Sphingobium subterraneum]|uniref:Glycosyltransferase involved in cell wall biosynthesis n=1 Tax=Sphingobium subterraneum TaxID=627688 RepID=A0A841IWZ0_9SPHN|nr:glycosyltransferase family 4 protein [Sphingobium subterraneum]MBB6122800.1 glycosyltransferase involved in cell wall biosynthesis [Sphingobium subterraneum]
MKVAMVDPSLFTGRYDDSLCAALARTGADVSLLARPMRDTDAIQPEGYSYQTRFFGLSERARGVLGEGAVARAAKAAEYLLDARFGPLTDHAAADVVHVQWLPFASADAVWIERLLARPGRPALVHTVHNVAAYHGDAGVQGRGYAALLGRFDRLIVHGEESRTALIAQGLARDRIAVIPHPPMTLAQAREQDLAAVPDPVLPRLLFFGTIRPYKGFDLLIDACIAQWRSGARFELAVAGKPFMDIAPLLDAVRSAGFGDRLILDLGFLHEERLDAHLRKADIVVFPYRHIDSSGAFLSALHYGKAMLCSRVGLFAHLPEVRDGPAVVSCAPDDRESLAAAIGSLVGDAALRASFGQRALALRDAMGDWDAAARATLALYAQAMGTA